MSGGAASAGDARGDGGAREAAPEPLSRPGRDEGADEEPCLRCGVPLPARLMGCKGGHCPNCGHPYPHGDCSD